MDEPDAPHHTGQPFSNCIYAELAVDQQRCSGDPSVAPEPLQLVRLGGQPNEKHRKLSCRECQRLKIKCDRVFPCSVRNFELNSLRGPSCVRRGWSSLCPEGALISGQPGSRYILESREQLEDKISQLSSRMWQLEDALEASCSNQPHPLLAPGLRSVKTSQDLYTSQSVLTQQTIPANNNASRVEPIRSMHPQNANSKQPSRQVSIPPEAPPDALQLSTSFPFPWSMDLSVRKRIRDALPPLAEAQAICAEARKNALWQYNVDPSETFLHNLLHYCYVTPVHDLSPRRLALLLMVLSIGSLVDLNKPLGNLYGKAYHHLARASVSEIPLIEKPDFDLLHTLFLMIWYHLTFSGDEKALVYAWNLMGFAATLAQRLGLHRDESRMKRIPEVFEKRRAIFWELLYLDCRMSLSLGLPPSICLAHVDAKPPIYNGLGLYGPREEVIYYQWKNSFFVSCLTPILQTIVDVTLPDYAHILFLDSKVRDFDMPKLLGTNESSTNASHFLNMQRALFSTNRDLGTDRFPFIDKDAEYFGALLQLHHCYFTQAMRGPESLDLHHKYYPSVLATYLGASSLIKAVQALFDQEPNLSTRFLHFWRNVFSAAVTLGLFISRAPSTSVTPYALQDLEAISRLFMTAGKMLPFSAKALPIIEKLVEKCRRSCRQHRSGTTDNERPFELLPSFQSAHPTLVQFAEQIKYTSSPIPPLRGRQDSNTLLASNAWLPDIHQFSSVGLETDGGYTFTSAQPTSFTPSLPRVGQNESLIFDGASTADFKEASYMATWF
ncbi:hypothetical protein F5887DRAFT_1079053 [Amanita rubescens]|nr:hypothetical protein F5887DRAFT_1079053 [Amanita rubescens]